MLCYNEKMKLVIVESPAKAKTIEKYLGAGYKVMSSVGHIRQIAKGNEAVDVAHDFRVTYEIEPSKQKLVAELRRAVAAADEVLLATDEDREGEAISWHLREVLGLPAKTKRITFHEITKTALEEALQHPRTVDQAMVESQQTRQTLIPNADGYAEYDAIIYEDRDFGSGGLSPDHYFTDNPDAGAVIISVNGFSDDISDIYGFMLEKDENGRYSVVLVKNPPKAENDSSTFSFSE